LGRDNTLGYRVKHMLNGVPSGGTEWRAAMIFLGFWCKRANMLSFGVKWFIWLVV
jgi:hypothetical protein